MKIMRYVKPKALGVIVVLLALVACVPTDDTVAFDETLLYGEWIEGTVHDTYFEDGSGYSWDTSDDITEEEASPFEWSLTSNQLRIIHQLWNGTVVPKTYTVRTLNSSFLIYEDDYGTAHEYKKVTTKQSDNTPDEP